MMDIIITEVGAAVPGRLYDRHIKSEFVPCVGDWIEVDKITYKVKSRSWLVQDDRLRVSSLLVERIAIR